MTRFAISNSAARRTLAGLWLLFFMLNLSVICCLYLRNWIEEDNFWAAVSEVNSLYVVYLGAVIAFYFMDRQKRNLKGPRSGLTFALAISCSILWNCVISVFIAVRLPLGMGTVEDSIKQIGHLGPLLSWVVAPSIGYYFAHSSNDATKSGQ